MMKGIATAVAALVLFTSPAHSQLAEEGINDLGNKYKIFIYAKESRGQGKWNFQTKTVAEGISKPYYSSWQKADCWNSTINGKFVGAVKIRPGGRGGGFSDAGILKAVCGQGR